MIQGLVMDLAAKPQAGLLVFAADPKSDAITAMAVSDAHGRFELLLPRQRHHFGVFSSRLGPSRWTARGPTRFDLVVAPIWAGADGSPDAAAGAFAPISVEAARLVRGRVVDEVGAGLAGVRIEATRPSQTMATATVSGSRGEFALPVLAGQSELRAQAPGLKLLSSTQRDGRLIIVLTVAAEVQRVTVSAGRVLRFNPADSIDPEYTPPAPVRAWLLFAYGLCPRSRPLKAHERRALKKYWYLDVLRRAPPNPASITTADCTPADLHQQLPPFTINVQGFLTWLEPTGREGD